MGAIVCKLDRHRGTVQRGYIAMLAVDKDFRKKKIGVLAMQEGLVGLCTQKQETKRNERVLCTSAGSNLAKKAIFQMIRSKEGCDEASKQKDYTLLPSSLHQ